MEHIILYLPSTYSMVMSMHYIVFITIRCHSCSIIQAIRGGKLIPLKSIMDEAVKMAPSVQKVFVMDRTGAVELTSSKDVSLESVISFTYLLFITFTYFQRKVSYSQYADKLFRTQ